jgi:hypothetical protein
MKSFKLGRTIGAVLAPMLFVSLGAVGAPGGGGGGGGGGQASITLDNYSVTFCNKQETLWSISKTATLGGLPVTQVNDGDTVDWKIDITSSAGATTLCAVGQITVTNTGTATATIGNFVVNLQGMTAGPKSKWVSLAADMADAANQEDATFANIVAAASTEAAGAHYVLATGAYTGEGTFTPSPKSGKLYMTMGGNDVWAITPGLNLPTCAAQPTKCTITFDFEAFFDPTIVTAGQSVRVEVIATFGNAGLRGGSGSSLSTPGIDINGNLLTNDPGENNIRSVPSRYTTTIPSLYTCTPSVALTDDFTSVGVSADQSSFPSGLISGEAHLTYSTVLSLLDSTAAGTASNTATIKNKSTELNDCCDVVDVPSTAAVTVNPVDCNVNGTCGQCPPDNPRCVPRCNPANGDICKPGETPYCSFTQGGYGGKGGPYVYLSNNAGAVFPLTVGGTYTMQFSTAANVGGSVGSPKSLQTDYLPQGGTAGVLTASLVNPLTSSSGVFGGQVTTFKINGLLFPALLNLYVGGQKVADILALANATLGGGTYTDADAQALNGLIDNLNQSFDNCLESDWAFHNLSTQAPPTP